MMQLITGVPGAGKTLYAVQRIVDEVKEGREVYTNIAGIAVDGVQPIPEHNDWRELPDGSLVVYDEAHQIFPTSGRPGLSSDPRINDMDMHRHRGFDLCFVTQFPTKVHHEIRSMVDDHVHLLRNFGAPSATVYRWPEATNVNDREARGRADSSPWVYPRSLYKLYKSSEIHTAKTRIPAKIKFVGLVVLVLGTFVGCRLASAGGFASINTQPAAVADVSASAIAKPRRTTPASVPQFSGCVASARFCRCYDNNGDPVEQTEFDCLAHAHGDRPGAFNLFSLSK